MESEAFIQGSDEWKAARLGKVTASRVSDVLAKTKSGYGAGRGNYMAELIAERLTGVSADNYTNAAMAWGTATEDEARASYEFQAGVVVETVGFVAHPSLAMCGASPDGLVGDDGLLEIKCPNTKTHIDTLLGRSIPSEYVTQMLWQMACTGRAWCDFVSYDPRLPETMRLFVKRLERDDERIAEITKEVEAFLKELSDKEASLRNIYEKAAA
jgi:putative phage-type endonuclease